MADFEALINKHADEEGNIPASAINAIVTAIKKAVGNEFVDKERYKTKLTEIEGLKEQLATAEDNATTAGQWEEKYNALKEESEKKYGELEGQFDEYKNAQAAKELKAAKVTAYKGLLKESGLPDKLYGVALKAADIDGIELDDDGHIKNADTVKATIEEDWGASLQKDGKVGAQTEKPPKNNGGSTMTKEEIMAIKDTSKRQKAIAENAELFGLE